MNCKFRKREIESQKQNLRQENALCSEKNFLFMGI